MCHGLKGSISDCQGRSQVVHWGAVGSGGLGYGEGEGEGSGVSWSEGEYFR